MISSKKGKKFLSLDIGSYAIKFIETEHKNDKIILKNFGYGVFEPYTFVEGYLISQNNVIDLIKNLIKEYAISTKNSGIIIPGNKSIIKRTKIPSGELATEDFEEKVYLQAEQTIPYNISEVQLSYDILNPNIEEQEEVEIILVASKKEIINDYKVIVEEAKLFPLIADIDFFCLQNIFEYNYGEEFGDKIVGILNLGGFYSNFVILHNNEGIFYRDFNIGASMISKSLEKKLKISFEEAESMKLKNVNNYLLKDEKRSFFNEVKKELSKSIELFVNSSNFEKIDIIFLTGGGSMIKGFKQFLENFFTNIEFSYFESFKKFEIDNKKIDEEYLKFISPLFAPVSGLALRGGEID